LLPSGCTARLPDGRIRRVNIGKVIRALILALVVVFVLYEVNFVFDAAGAGNQQIPDPEIEAVYDACYRQKDDEIHATAFGTIDNPDVQKEFIASSRARAADECRRLHPERLITVAEPPRSGFIEIKPRFW
jgi:hypothetical protein